MSQERTAAAVILPAACAPATAEASAQALDTSAQTPTQGAAAVAAAVAAAAAAAAPPPARGNQWKNGGRRSRENSAQWARGPAPGAWGTQAAVASSGSFHLLLSPRVRHAPLIEGRCRRFSLSGSPSFRPPAPSVGRGRDEAPASWKGSSSKPPFQPCSPQTLPLPKRARCSPS